MADKIHAYLTIPVVDLLPTKLTIFSYHWKFAGLGKVPKTSTP
jgi:hypothetical protein